MDGWIGVCMVDVHIFIICHPDIFLIYFHSRNILLIFVFLPVKFLITVCVCVIFFQMFAFKNYGFFVSIYHHHHHYIVHFVIIINIIKHYFYPTKKMRAESLTLVETRRRRRRRPSGPIINKNIELERTVWIWINKRMNKKKEEEETVFWSICFWLRSCWIFYFRFL